MGESNLYSFLSPPVLPDAMDISTSTWLPIHHTIGWNTDSVGKKEFAAQLREVDEIDQLEAQVKEKEDELFCLPKCSDLLRNWYEHLLKDNEVLTRDVHQITTRLKELREDKQVTRATERAVDCLYAILQSFAETNCERLTAADCCRFIGFPETATPHEIRRQYLRLQRLTHPDQNPTCPKYIAIMLTVNSDCLLRTKNKRIPDCCGLRAFRNRNYHLCSFCCPFYDFDISTQKYPTIHGNAGLIF